MEPHFEILIDASGSMGYMKGAGEKHEDKYLLPDDSTRTDLVKKILKDNIVPNLGSNFTFNIRAFRNEKQLDNNNQPIIVENSHQVFPDLKLIHIHSIHTQLSACYNAIDEIENPNPGGTPLFWALSQTIINSKKNEIKIIVLSDGDANDNPDFDTEILKIIKETEKECNVYFIGIDQSALAKAKSQNLVNKTGGIYANLKAMNYDKNALNVLLSKLDTAIVSKALDHNIKETQSIAATKIIEVPKIEIKKQITETENIVAEVKEVILETKSATLEKQVHKNTQSLEYISSQLNNIIKLLHAQKVGDSEIVEVVENTIHNQRIGRLAEKFLYQKLQVLFKETSTKVTWLNEIKEQGFPYDFLLEKDMDIFYYECKGTASDLNEFQLTKNEWDFYIENQGKYRLCFVSNVESEPSYIRYMDLLEDMREKKLIPCSTQNKVYKANRIVFQILNA